MKDYGFKFKKDGKTSKSYLSGQTFVITGTLDNYSRQDVVDMIESNGGSVTTSVSKNTDYLIYGTKPGSKYEKAETLEVVLLNETEFENLINKYKKSN